MNHNLNSFKGGSIEKSNAAISWLIFFRSFDPPLTTSKKNYELKQPRLVRARVSVGHLLQGPEWDNAT